MKIKTLIAACFAGAGIYLTLTGSVTAVLSYSMLTIGGDPINMKLTLLQYLAFCYPLFIGVLFLAFASPLAALVCHLSKISDEKTDSIIHPETAILIACVVTGLVMLIGHIPEFMRIIGKHFLSAASAEYAAGHRGQDSRLEIISHTIYMTLASLVILKAKAMARWYVSRYEK